MQYKIIILAFVISSLISSCDKALFVNERTSEIGSLNPYCLDKNTWDSLQRQYSVDSIRNERFGFALNEMRKHWTSPEYFLYFKEGPEELIACEYYAVRLVYNPTLSGNVLAGLDDSLLTDEEQVRVRNRVINLLISYSCDTGRAIFNKELKEPAVFGKEYYEKYKEWYEVF